MNVTRDYWLSCMIRIVEPVLLNIAEGKLFEKMPKAQNNSSLQKRSQFMTLEAFGRTVCGIAPWLENIDCYDEEEVFLRKRYIGLAIRGFENILDRFSTDYIDFEDEGQRLVDTAYLVQGLLRAPNSLWNNIPSKTRDNLIVALKKTRKFKPSNTNWLLFASIIEVALLKYTGVCNEKRLNKGIHNFIKRYYVGDGFYGDGSHFHMDYYNSYVIHPMLLDSLIFLKSRSKRYSRWYNLHLKRQQRLSEILVRFIMPEGYYPVFGRTITCRFGAFHAVSQTILENNLPDSLTFSQLNGALTAVLKKHFEADLFDENGWLKIGFMGEQMSLAEGYISYGSVYHSVTMFLPLGLPKTHEFWSTDNTAWSTKNIWENNHCKLDLCYDEQSIFDIVNVNKLFASISKFLALINSKMYVK